MDTGVLRAGGLAEDRGDIKNTYAHEFAKILDEISAQFQLALEALDGNCSETSSPDQGNQRTAYPPHRSQSES